MKVVQVSKRFWQVTSPMLDDRETVTTKSVQDLAMIILYLGEYQMVHVEDSTTDRDVCDNLKKIYAELSTANRMRLYEKLRTLRLNNGDEAKKHVHEIEITRIQLRKGGVEIGDML